MLTARAVLLKTENLKLETAVPPRHPDSSASRRNAVTDDFALRSVAALNGYSHDSIARSLSAVAASSSIVFLQETT